MYSSTENQPKKKQANRQIKTDYLNRDYRPAEKNATGENRTEKTGASVNKTPVTPDSKIQAKQKIAKRIDRFKLRNQENK